MSVSPSQMFCGWNLKIGEKVGLPLFLAVVNHSTERDGSGSVGTQLMFLNINLEGRLAGCCPAHPRTLAAGLSFTSPPGFAPLLLRAGV